MMPHVKRYLRCFRWPSVVLATITCFAPAAISQNVAEQEALARNCVAISIDQCYRDGLVRLIDNDFLPDISKILDDSQKNVLKSVKFMVVADRDALGAGAGYASGQAYIRITSSVGYHISLFANAVVLNIFLGKDPPVYAQYQEKAVAVLADNVRRARLGQPLLPTPSYADAEAVERSKLSELMNNPTVLGMSSYVARLMTYWVLAHEVGHQVLGHARLIAEAPGTPRKEMEVAADNFAARAMIKMGYSVYPTIFLMEYFSAVEKNGSGSLADYPPALCRLAMVFRSGWSERDRSKVSPRDAANQRWNEVMDNPGVKETVGAILSGSQCRS